MNKHIIFGLLLTLWLLPSLFGCGGGGGSSSADNSNGEPGSATLTWDAPTTSEDGSPLDDLAGYKIYFGYSSQSYANFLDVGMPSCQKNDGITTCSYTLTGLASGRYFFAVTAYDLSGNESIHSNEVTRTVR